MHEIKTKNLPFLEKKILEAIKNKLEKLAI